MRSSGSSCAISDSIAAHTGTTSAPSSTARFSTTSRYGLSLKPFSATLATYISGLAVIRQYSRSSGRSAASISQRAHRLARIEVLTDALQQLALADRVLVAGLRRLLGALQAALDGLEVGERQLGVDHLDVGQRVDLAGDVHDVVVDEAAHHLRDGVRLADVREELVAEAFALRGAGHEARDVHELDRGRQHLLGLGDVGQRLQPQVRHRHHAHVGIDGAERIVGRRGVLRLRDRVEERGLADVRQADDAAFDAQGEDAPAGSVSSGRLCSDSRGVDSTSHVASLSRPWCAAASWPSRPRRARTP